MPNHSNFCKDILFGVAIGDAIGVPVELSEKSMNELAARLAKVLPC
jgi:ADP-ribosylglycohydrolase